MGNKLQLLKAGVSSYSSTTHTPTNRYRSRGADTAGSLRSNDIERKCKILELGFLCSIG